MHIRDLDVTIRTGLPELRGKITLQINTNGAWRNVLTFEPANRDRVLSGLRVLAGILGESAKWCLLREDGSRERLPGLGPWQPITADQPAPLEDVLVSVYQPFDMVATVFQAYRRSAEPRQWFISGTDHERVVGEVYAWAPCLEPAAHPSVQQVVA